MIELIINYFLATKDYIDCKKTQIHDKTKLIGCYNFNKYQENIRYKKIWDNVFNEVENG